ncbi:hypothetical protein EDD86DRAFT_219466 [Gorgonomyces haynaldii]|nr:hypothetical protein EDD86DRAFT_219466 [Gorgonomyces haynaldii]
MCRKSSDTMDCPDEATSEQPSSDRNKQLPRHPKVCTIKMLLFSLAAAQNTLESSQIVTVVSTQTVDGTTITQTQATVTVDPTATQFTATVTAESSGSTFIATQTILLSSETSSQTDASSQQSTATGTLSETSSLSTVSSASTSAATAQTTAAAETTTTATTSAILTSAATTSVRASLTAVETTIVPSKTVEVTVLSTSVEITSLPPITTVKPTVAPTLTTDGPQASGSKQDTTSSVTLTSVLANPLDILSLPTQNAATLSSWQAQQTNSPEQQQVMKPNNLYIPPETTELPNYQADAQKQINGLGTNSASQISHLIGCFVALLL